MEEGSKKQTFISTDFSSKKGENFEWQCIFDCIYYKRQFLTEMFQKQLKSQK
jgi:hypothetical protein